MDPKFTRRSVWALVAAAGLCVVPSVMGMNQKEDQKPAKETAKQVDKKEGLEANPNVGGFRKLDPSEVTPEMREAMKARQAQQGDQKEPTNVKTPDPAAPRFSADPEDSPFAWSSMTHDWGVIDDAERVKHIFSFTNTSDQTLSIRARGSCGCTVPQLVKSTYEPGETGEITVEFNPHGRRGNQTKYVNIEFTNAPDLPQTRLTLTSNIRPMIMVDPIRMNVPRVDHGVGYTEEIVVSARKPDFKLVGVSTDNPYVTATIGDATPMELDGEIGVTVPVEVTIAPDAPIGKLTANINFDTGDSAHALSPHPVNATVYGDLEATPQTLRIREVEPNTPFESEIRLSSAKGHKFNIVSADIETSRPMSVAVDFEERDVNGQPATFIKLVGTTPIAFGSTTGELVVKTDLEDGLEIRIPFYAVVRRVQRASR